MVNQVVWVMACLVLWVQCENKTFVPTDEWQTVENDMEIPAGLHVRMNLQTGKKEAKLIKEEKSSEKSSLITVEDEKPFSLSQDELVELLKNIKNEDKSEGSSKKKFRSYEEIKSEFSSEHMDVKTDVEILHNLIDEYHLIRNGSVEMDEPEERLNTIVQDLEYLVHQYDNAIEFAQAHGIEKIILPCLNGTEDSAALRNSMLKLLGSAAQNNPRVQKAAVDANIIPVLLRILVKYEDSSARSRTTFALSSLLRWFPPGQVIFLQQGGLAILATVFEDPKHPDTKVAFKIVNLLTDLLRELREANEWTNKHIKEIYSPVRSQMNVREGGWCSRASSWFLTVTTELDELDHAMVESTVDLLLEFTYLDCLSDLVVDLKLVSGVNFTKQVYTDLVLQDQDDGETDSYFAQIVEKLKTLAAVLARTTKYKDEL